MIRKCPPGTPKLSETLRGAIDRNTCQSCGTVDRKIPGKEWAPVLQVFPWIECDDFDAKTPVFVFLCEPCAQRIVDPHPRLYIQEQKLSPLPGAMDICQDCKWRDFIRCRCPLAVFNGGAEPGLKIDVDPPGIAFVRRPRNKGGSCRVAIWTAQAKGCSGHETIK